MSYVLYILEPQRTILISILILLITIISTQLNCFGAVKGGIEYNIPIDYSKLSEVELNKKAKIYFYNALKYKDSTMNPDITNSLVIYSILQRINPENINYPIKLGILYDKLEKDRQAKGSFSKASCSSVLIV